MQAPQSGTSANYRHGDMFGQEVDFGAASVRGDMAGGGGGEGATQLPPPSPTPSAITTESIDDRSSARRDMRRRNREIDESEPMEESEEDLQGLLDSASASAVVADDPPVDSENRPLYAEAATTTPEAGANPPGQEGAAAGEGDQQAVADAPGGPLLIYEAQLNLAVHEVRERIDQVVEVADEVGGFLQAQDDTSVIIRVPARRFREALGQVEALGDVLSRQVSAQDVSDQVRDVRIRLRNAIQMRDRLAELLERAQTVPDSLTIERELERLTQSIELLRGQLRALEDRVAYSTITVRFQAVRVDQEVVRERFRLPFPWLDELGLVNLLRL